MQCGTKQIIEHLNSSGHDIKALFICGGLSKNSLFVTCHADVTGKLCHNDFKCIYVSLSGSIKNETLCTAYGK
jgi:ribulose kinase